MRFRYIYLMRLYATLLFSLYTIISSPAVSQTKTQLESLNKKLENIYDLDQGIRDTVHYYESRFGFNSPEGKAAYIRMHTQDSINQHTIFRLLDTQGWPDKKQISKKASQGIFFVLQHAELEAQEKYNPMVDQAFASGQLESWSYAFYKDRINMRQGKFQQYGSQVGRDALGNVYVFPIADEPNVDKRRQKLKMGSLKQHLKDNGIEEYELPATDTLTGKIVVIGHIMDGTQKGIEGVEVYLKDQLIATSNRTGFIRFPVSKDSQEKLIFSLKKAGCKTISFPISGNKDFYDLYFQLK